MPTRSRSRWSAHGFLSLRKKLSESYVQKDRRDTRTIKPIKIAEGHYFFMGDNRSSSCDSREWGTVPRGNLIGKVFAVYWPPSRISFR